MSFILEPLSHEVEQQQQIDSPNKRINAVDEAPVCVILALVLLKTKRSPSAMLVKMGALSAGGGSFTRIDSRVINIGMEY